MGRFHDQLTPDLRRFIERQRMFFIATAAAEGRINLSPKGMQTFRVLDDRRVGYLDLTGSGNETAAHLRHDGRMTVMFCSFDEKPLILRLYGRGRVVRPGDAEWEQTLARFEPLAGQRQIMLLEVESVQTSCGWGVPMYAWQAEREELPRWVEKLGSEGLERYRRQNNRQSIDGLPVPAVK
jgi:hypothetical protein